MDGIAVCPALCREHDLARRLAGHLCDKRAGGGRGWMALLLGTHLSPTLGEARLGHETLHVVLQRDEASRARQAPLHSHVPNGH